LIQRDRESRLREGLDNPPLTGEWL
jgi:hypothetical protein